MLTNEPYCVTDITYIFLFYFCLLTTKYSKMGQEMIEERREWDRDSVPSVT